MLQNKFFVIVISAMVAFLYPLYPSLIFIGSLVVLDFMTGCVKALKDKNFSSSKAIRKVYVSAAYLLCLLVAKTFEDYFKIPDQLAIKAVVGIISVSELQSLRENIKSITGIDILKDLAKIVEKKKGN